MATEQSKPVIHAQLPRVPSTLPVYEVRAKTLDERSDAIRLFQQRLKLGDSTPVRIEESVRFVGQTGEVEFYRPSGALWARDYASSLTYKDERRPWDSKIVKTEEGPAVALDDASHKRIVGNAEGLFHDAKLRSEHAYLADVVLDQVHSHSPDGKKELFPGEATVRFLYRLRDLSVAGPGAKSYVFFQEADRLAGVYHVWRDVVAEHKAEATSAEAALELWFKQDKQIVYSLKLGRVVDIDSVELVYFAMPPSKFQDFVFPAFRVIGFIHDGKERTKGTEFARFCHALPPKAYARANLLADTLMIRP